MRFWVMMVSAMSNDPPEKLLESLFGALDLSARGATFDSIDPDLLELAVLGVSYHTRRNVLWIVGENEEIESTRKRLQDWRPLLGLNQLPICSYSLPFEDPYINNSVEDPRMEEKLDLLDNLRQDHRPLLVITTLTALNLPVETPRQLTAFSLDPAVGTSCNRDHLIRELLDYGYRLKDFIQKKGDLSYRGSVVDVYPVNTSLPFRMEIEEDALVSIREFDPVSQRSTRRVSRLRIFKNRYFLVAEDLHDHLKNDSKTLPLLDVLGNPRVILSDIQQTEAGYHRLREMFSEFFQLKKKEEPDTRFFPLLDLSPSVRKSAISLNTQVYVPERRLAAIRAVRPGVSYRPDGEIPFLRKKHARGMRIMVFDPRPDYFNYLADLLPGVTHSPYSLPRSLEDKDSRILLWSPRPPSPEPSTIPSRKTREAPAVELERLEEGDLLVHRQHGVGRFTGIRRLELEDHSGDFYRIEYRNSEYLYIPVHETNVLNLYSSLAPTLPPLDKLGGKSWAQKKKKARKHIREYAHQLLDLYSRRQSAVGRSYPPQPDLEDPCIQDFKYLLTRDQDRAIRAVLTDLEKECPMDRLICGDVGFGKTEVAVRAALRVVSNGMQVALLTPTTILAYQHFQTFRERFRSLPVKIKMLSRLVKKREREKIARELSQGKVDILIGTHALLGPQVTFPSLGLYILDEEQRFGVFQKEQLKENREDVDVLTLTATPIPRTLSLSMAGIADISIISTPPLGRMAVKNYIGHFQPSVIVSAVRRELDRGGQVFVIYNDIAGIFPFREQLGDWLGPVPVGVIHARMTPRQVEQNLLAFIRGKYAVLISTTIIENGIDISNVNTLIVVGAEKFGLTQLYQLRGRIGRSTRQAYAFFLLRQPHLTEKARRRLEGIKEFVDLGAGYQIARYDYRLRGAGTLLGNRQHGHIEALGFDYYNELLQESVRELRGQKKPLRSPRITVAFPTRLESLTHLNPGMRIHLYKKILEADSIREMNQIRNELVDRFGTPGVELDKILYIGLIRLWAITLHAPQVDVHLDHLTFFTGPEFKTQHPLLDLFSTRIQGNRLTVRFQNFYRLMETLMSAT